MMRQAKTESLKYRGDETICWYDSWSHPEIPALASTFFNIGSVGFGVILGYLLGPRLGIEPITGMAVGVVFGGALQLAWQLPALRAEGFRFHPAIDWNHPLLRKIFSLMGPAILGSAAVQINVLVITNFASRIPGNGPVSWLAYSFRFMQLPLGLFGVAIASATLPSISRSAGAGDFDEFRRTLSKSLGMVFLLKMCIRDRPHRHFCRATPGPPPRGVEGLPSHPQY